MQTPGTPVVFAAAAGLVVLGGGLGWCAASRGDPGGAVAEGTATELARMRRAAEERGARIAGLEAVGAATAKDDSPGAVDGSQPSQIANLVDPLTPFEVRSKRIDRLAGSVADLERRLAAGRGSTSPDPAERGRRIVAGLEAVTDARRGLALDEAVRELVRIGDPAVPGIVAALDSGLQRYYFGRDGFSMSAGEIGYSSLRTVLIDALGQIGSPAAKEGLLHAVGRSELLGDARDLLATFSNEKDPPVVAGISALVPGILRRVAERGVERCDQEAALLDRFILDWLGAHEVREAPALLEEIVSGARPGSDGWWRHWDMELVQRLVVLAPDRAARAVLAIRERNPQVSQDREPVFSFSIRVSMGAPLATLAHYYDLLFSQGNLDPKVRSNLYAVMPTRLEESFQDLKAREEDAAPMVAFLEERLAAETDDGMKSALRSVLGKLRNAIEHARR